MAATSDDRRRTERLLRERFALLVSLPRNDLELAKVALDAGADGLKVHINLHHHASGLDTGTLDQEAGRIEEIIALGAPVGIVPGAGDSVASPEEMRRLDAMGIDFFDLYAEDMPAWMLRMSAARMSVMVAFSAECRPWGLVEHVQEESRPDMIEASIIAHEGYGGPLTAADVSAYAEIARRSGLPVAVPTQRAIRPEEVAVLRDAGAAAVLIGAIVTGAQPDGVARATEAFRRGVDRLT
jgi:hypothetical protein